MNQSRVPNWSPEVPLLDVDVSLISVLVAHGLSWFPCEATVSRVTFRPQALRRLSEVSFSSSYFYLLKCFATHPYMKDTTSPSLF